MRTRGADVQGVVFDLFETLVTESNTRPAGASSLGPRLGLAPMAFREQWKRRRAALMVGQLSFVQALSDIGTDLGSALEPAQLEALQRERVSAKAAALAAVEADVLGLLDRLRRDGKRIGVISNCMAEDVATWPKSRLAERIHAAVFSFEVGVAKPDPAIYREAARRLELVPEVTLFIGDGADEELAGAARAGFRAFRADWFLARWNHFQPARTPGLQSIEQVAALVAGQ